MEYLQNLHTHTSFCDGKNTPSELLDIAISKGFHSIGFSGHSANVHSKAYTNITKNTTRAYKDEIRRLRKEYEDRIKLFLGLEFEMLSDDDLSDVNILSLICDLIPPIIPLLCTKNTLAE